MISPATLPTSEPLATSARSMSPVDRCAMPMASLILVDCVPFPPAGGATMIRMCRCACGSAGGSMGGSVGGSAGDSAGAAMTSGQRFAHCLAFSLLILSPLRHPTAGSLVSFTSPLQVLHFPELDQ